MMVKNPDSRKSSTSSEICVVVEPLQDSGPSSVLKRELEEVFRFFDANGDGKISAMELGSVLRALGDNPTDKELESMIHEVDTDGDGFIDMEEFINLNTKGLGLGCEGGATSDAEMLKATFEVFDADKNGYISADELHCVLTGLGDKNLTMEDCHFMIKSVDRDGDGFVDFEEFRLMMVCY